MRSFGFRGFGFRRRLGFPVISIPVLSYEAQPTIDTRLLLRQLLWLALPVLAENVLHIFVGLNDTYLAAHLPANASHATAAVGLVTYVIWLLGLLAGAIGSGSTAIIARAMGAKHQRVANSVCGQSVTAAFLAGIVATALIAMFASPLARAMGLKPENPAMEFTVFYLRILGLSIITDMCLPDALEPANLPDIIAIANAAEKKVRVLVRRVVAEL